MGRKTGVVLSYVLMIFEVLSTLLLTPYIIRTLGQAEYGVYKLITSVNGYLLLLDMGVGNSIIRFVAKYRAEGDRLSERRFLGVANVYYIIVAVVACAAGVAIIAVFPTVFAVGLSEEEVALGQLLVGINTANSAVTLATAAYSNVVIAYERFAVSRGASIVQIIIRMLLTWGTLAVGLGSVGIVVVNLAMTVVCRGFFVWYVSARIRLTPSVKGVDSSFVKEVGTYSTFILIQMIATQLNASIDQILLGVLVPAASIVIAVYGVGMQIVQYFQSIGSAFTSVLMPGIVRLVEGRASPDAICAEMVRVGRIIFMPLALVWACFVAFGDEFVCLWAGEDNADAYIVSLVLMSAYLIVLTMSVGGQVLWAMNAHHEQSVMKMAVVLVNIGLTVLLIKIDPLLGATFGTFTSLMVGDFLVECLIFRKKIGISLRFYFEGMAKGLVPCALSTAAFGLLAGCVVPSGWFGFAAGVVLTSAFYCAFVWVFGMNLSEKELAISLFSKLPIRQS